MMCSIRERQVLVKCDEEKSGKVWVQDVENCGQEGPAREDIRME